MDNYYYQDDLNNYNEYPFSINNSTTDNLLPN